jgi:hypothetical protein
LILEENRAKRIVLVSLRPRLVPDIPEETAHFAKAAYRKGNPYLKMRDELGIFFSDEQFIDLYNPLFRLGV